MCSGGSISSSKLEISRMRGDLAPLREASLLAATSAAAASWLRHLFRIRKFPARPGPTTGAKNGITFGASASMDRKVFSTTTAATASGLAAASASATAPPSERPKTPTRVGSTSARPRAWARAAAASSLSPRSVGLPWERP